ncbi:MAG: hypothetical protein NTU94_10650 [Planctomycetota bacterium]|nr:hypothetical protein [Planctomycetota bacterium]
MGKVDEILRRHKARAGRGFFKKSIKDYTVGDLGRLWLTGCTVKLILMIVLFLVLPALVVGCLMLLSWGSR